MNIQSDNSPPLSIVCLHGFAANRQSWLGLQSALESCRQVHTIDLPGHGENWQQDPPRDLQTLAADLWKVQQPGGIDLAGHSLGGAVALHMASLHPQRVRSISLLAPVGLGQGVNRTVLKALLQMEDESDALEWLKALVHDPKFIPPVLASMLMAHLQRPGVNGRLASIATQMHTGKDALQHAIETVVKHEIPRQVIWGRQDTLNAPNEQDIDRFGGHWEMLNSCGHLAHVEKRVRAGELVLELLTNHNSAS